MWWQNWRSNSGLSSHKPQIGVEEGGVKKEDREREEIRREKRKQVIAWGLQRKEAREHCCSARNPLADLQESFLLIVWDRAKPSNL